MGRPAKPLISRDRAARAALSVIDVHGLEALSLELVGQRMGVRAPSLYYHFKHKAELLSEIARLLLLDVQVPDAKGMGWKEALLSLSIATRRSILQHPNAAPLLLQFFPRHLLLAAYDHWIATCSLPADRHMVLIEGLEKITLGSALFEASCRSRGIAPMPQFDRGKLPHLAGAVRANGLDDEALFIATMTAFLDGLSPATLAAPVRKVATAQRASAKKKKPAAARRA